MAGIVIRGLSKRYVARSGEASRPALAGLDLDVADGELLVMVGPSGCGKSTALRLLAGLEEPTRGSLRLVDEDGERDLSGVPPQDRDIAMVFQGYALYPHLSVRDNIAFPLKMRGVPPSERQARVQEVAEVVGLSDKLGRLPAELSGGERQRVAMGRAIVRSPAVFLFDEPLSNLDAKLRAELRVDLSALVRRLGTTAVYVTHDQAEAMTMGDRIAVLRDGVLQQVAPPRVIYQEPANTFVASFVGTPAMNLVEMMIGDGRATSEDLFVDAPGAVRDHDTVTVGFRPEHLEAGEGAGLSFEASVVAAEPLGPETLVHLSVGGTALRARLAGFVELESGTGGGFYVPAERLLWFDADGERIAG